jgi:hypothetical protein
LSSTAATIAVATAPPLSSTEATANCAEPANVVSEKTSGATTPIPASRARIPNDAPNAAAASAIGATARAPASISLRDDRLSCAPATNSLRDDRLSRAPLGSVIMDSSSTTLEMFH